MLLISAQRRCFIANSLPTSCKCCELHALSLEPINRVQELGEFHFVAALMTVAVFRSCIVKHDVYDLVGERFITVWENRV